MANVTFENALGRDAFLHMRIGPVDVDPAVRMSKNTVVKSAEAAEIQVDDGDVWYCFGNQVVGAEPDTALCNAAGGSLVTLESGLACYVRN